jgi:aminoglycoside phosphotransferase (APT) family kinase protein
MDQVDIVVSHQERLTARVGNTYVKVDAAAWRLAREVDAMALVTVPTPDVLWHHDNVLGLREVRGSQLGRLGEPSMASAAVWAEAGALAREIHALPLPPWSGWDADEFSGFIEGECGWLVDHGVISSAVARSAMARTEPALQPFDMVFTHGDYQPAHVLHERGSITGIIDWADACSGAAAFDLAVLTVGHEERTADVLAGYGDAMDMEVIRSWWAVRRIGSVRWMIEHGFNADDDVIALLDTTRA